MRTNNTYAVNSNRLRSSPSANYAYNADGNPSSVGANNFGYNSYGSLNTMSSPSLSITRTFNGVG